MFYEYSLHDGFGGPAWGIKKQASCQLLNILSEANKHCAFDFIQISMETRNVRVDKYFGRG
uniref:Uncharacterized protein n=1 Tax=Arion vulgaris TaxID=1028688 RepID=A0A0B7AHF9_9EUPU